MSRKIRIVVYMTILGSVMLAEICKLNKEEE